MKALVISKPVYDYILPLVDFPEDGDNFFIESSIKTISSIGSIIAITLANYGVDTSFTGVVGEDDIGNKIKEIFNNNKVDTSYIETNYTEHTCINHKIYNSKTNKFTSIEEKSIKQGLIKYKYEFIPDIVIMDDGDYNANMASINNYPESNSIYIGEKFTKDSSVYCNKCKYVISNLSFASVATGILNNLNKPKTIVSIFQKYIDLYNSNLIIKLDNFDFLYCVNDEVRLIKNTNNNLTNKDYLYYAVLIYFLINTNNIENSIKYTNKAMISSKNELDMIKNIPEFKEVNNLLEEIKILNTNQNNQLNNQNHEIKLSNTLNNIQIDNTNININAQNNVDNSNINNFNNNNTLTTQNINTNVEIKGDNDIEKL